MKTGPPITELPPARALLNWLAFPYRAFVLNPNASAAPFLCLRDERMIHVRRHVRGRVLDVGCGPDDVFVSHYHRDGIGVDVYRYPGLREDQIVDPLRLPFPADSFDTVTLIANVNHIPASKIAAEFQELGRVLRPDGRLVITRIGPVTSFLTHNVVRLQSRLSSRYYDMDHERGVEEDERLSVPVGEIDRLAGSIGARRRVRERIWTQWWLNEVLVYEREPA